jgi:hypothetical protein
MLKKFLFIAMLAILCLKANAQNGGYIEYVPNSSQPPSTQPNYTPPQQQYYNPPPQQYYPQEQQQPQSELVSGYIITSTGVRKVNLKVSHVDRSVYIVAVKELTANYWTDLTKTGAKASKLNSYEDYSDRFEYKIYIPVLGTTVYF